MGHEEGTVQSSYIVAGLYSGIKQLVMDRLAPSRDPLKPDLFVNTRLVQLLNVDHLSLCDPDRIFVFRPFHQYQKLVK